MLWRTKPPAKRPDLIEPCIPTPLAGDQAVAVARRGFDWTERYPRIGEAVAALRTASATLDGEAVWCDQDGLAIFDKLHSRRHDGEAFLYAFDLLELDGEDWRRARSRSARLLIYCSTGLCHHSATVDADQWPDDTVLRDLCPKAVCTKCGMIRADVRPNWQERSERESLTGQQWR